MSGSITPHEVIIVQEDVGQAVPDSLATEEPLEIRLATGDGIRPVAVTMRTPDHDEELAVGFLYGEGIIERRDDVVAMHRPLDRAGRPEKNILVVEMARGLEPDLRTLDRHFFTSSACGVCGKAGIEALLIKKEPVRRRGPRVRPEVLYGLPDSLHSRQSVFKSTGGLHAAGLYRADGEQLVVREDIGRHNALDKLVGSSLDNGRLPLDECVVMVSGRASYEILQKCLMADVTFVCAVSAPSSLAVSLARQFDITLVGFLRDRRLNISSGAERVLLPGCAATLPNIASMALLISVIPAPIERMVSGLRFPQLFLATALVFVADLLIPDLIPFVDEVLLGLFTVLLGTWRARASAPRKPEVKDVTPPTTSPEP